MTRARRKNPETLSALVEGTEVQASCTKTRFGDALPMLVGKTIAEKNLYAAFLSKRELEQSPFVAISPKNGRHRSSRRLQEHLSVERVEGQFNEYRSGAGTGSAPSRHFRAAFDAGLR